MALGSFMLLQEQSQIILESERRDRLRLISELEAEGRSALAREGHDAASVKLLRSLEMRYLGQEYSVTVAVPSKISRPEAMRGIRERFDELYEVRYGHAAPDQAAQIVNMRVTAIGMVRKPDFETLRDKRITAPVSAGERLVFFPGHGKASCGDLNLAMD